MAKEKKIAQEPEEFFNCFQALNHFKLIGRNRRVAEKKFSGQEKTVKEWEDCLKVSKLLN